MKNWPDNWPEYRNGSQLCDMIVGPCACGAWHQEQEFRVIDGEVWRVLGDFKELVGDVGCVV